MKRKKWIYRNAIKIKRELNRDLFRFKITLPQYIKGRRMCNQLIKKYGLDKSR